MENDRPIQGSSDPSDYTEVLTADGFPSDIQALYEHVTGRVIGQDRAARKVCRGIMVHGSGLGDEGRPIGSFLFSGPTGVGKTELAKELARRLIVDTPRAPATIIQCGKMKESHRVSELLGSPPGYVQSDKPGRLDQFKIDEPHFWVKCRPFLAKALRGAKNRNDQNQRLLALYEEHKPYTSVVVLDEIEKGHPDLWNLALHIIEDGSLEMANGSVTSFANTIVILTCNVGGREQQDLISGKSGPMGFSSKPARKESEPSDEDLQKNDREILELTRHLIGEKFPPELVGRLNENIIVFRLLTRLQQGTVLGNMLARIQERFVKPALPGSKLPRVPTASVQYSDRFREFVLDEGVDMKTGMRRLRAAVDRLAKAPLAQALGHKLIEDGDLILVDVQDKKPVVRRVPRPAVKLLPPSTKVGGDPQE